VHPEQIRTSYGYRAFDESTVGFRLIRRLYLQCWTDAKRPSVVFDRATTGMLARRLLLPGANVLEPLGTRLREDRCRMVPM
jgi:hypothetical protein